MILGVLEKILWSEGVPLMRRQRRGSTQNGDRKPRDELNEIGLAAPVLPNIPPRWVFTVVSAMPRAAAISGTLPTSTMATIGAAMPVLPRSPVPAV